jgi:hypothetical protein
METTRIFIASSSELSQDRKDFHEFLAIENDRLHKKGVYLELDQWEHFLDAVSPTRLQDEYNKRVKNAHILICLFYTKAGKYTIEEFDIALNQFKETGTPLIYTYFKSGAPEPDPNDQSAKDLIDFKKRLSDIGHFYTVYNNIDDLKYQFRKQLDRLEDKGFIVLKDEVKKETLEAVNNYFNVKNSVIGSTISAGGDINIGDKTTNTATAEGNNNIIIQGVTESTITVNVNGQQKDIEKKLDALQVLMEQMAVKSIQSANNTYNIGTITNVNFGYLMGQAGHDKKLPSDLAQNLVGEGNSWIQSLSRELISKQKVEVGNQAMDIFQNYGWLVQIFLQKMGTSIGQEKTLRRLSFMAEAYQASLRYLCYIQLAQVMQMERKPKEGIISDFIQMEGNTYLDFDYTSLLLITTDIIGTNGFMKEINQFVEELTDPDSSLYGAGIFLQSQRQNLIAGTITDDAVLPELLDEYLTALVYWLRKVSFIAKYRLVSIKDINLNYRLGTSKNFIHQYGELHGIYTEGDSGSGDYTSKSVEGLFTYNKSILLFNGTHISTCMNNIQDQSTYLCLSPLMIDQSVYTDKTTQTPEIYYFTGYEKAKRSYNYQQYKNELPFGGKENIASNKSIGVLEQNNNQSLLDELFEQLEDIFKPLKIKKV